MAKSHNSSTFTNQPQNQALKKDKRNHWEEHKDYLATRVNATKVPKNDKALKDLSYVKCYICYQKGHYANKRLNKPKNQQQFC